MTALHWTRPFCGLTHGYKAAAPSLASRWVTVSDRGTWAELTCNNPGFPFKTSHHDSVELAKAAGEAWMSQTA